MTDDLRATDASSTNNDLTKSYSCGGGDKKKGFDSLAFNAKYGSFKDVLCYIRGINTLASVGHLFKIDVVVSLILLKCFVSTLK